MDRSAPAWPPIAAGRERVTLAPQFSARERALPDGRPTPEGVLFH